MKPEQSLLHNEQTGRLEELTGRLKDYLDTRYELIRLKIVEKTAVSSSGILLYALLAVFALIMLILVSTGVAIYISNAMGNNYSGFFIVAGFYLLVILVVFIFKASLKSTIADEVVKELLE